MIFASPKQLKMSPGATVLKLVAAPESHTRITGSMEKAMTLAKVADLDMVTKFVRY